MMGQNTVTNGHAAYTNGIHQPTSLAAKNLRTLLQQQLNEIQAAGTLKTECIITTPQNAVIGIEESIKPVVNFCSNNYLGMADNPDVIEHAKKMMDEYGSGLSSARFICGTQSIHRELERKLSQFHGREDTILYSSCFDANAALFEALLTSEDAVFSDELNHASIIDGIRLCKAQRYRYLHSDMQDLEKKLSSSNARIKLIATDGVFSMDGDIASLKEICDLADKYNALVFIDECHGTGVFGETGRGTEERLNIMGRVHIINSSLGKSLGATGGYTTGSKELIAILKQRSRPYLFSNTLTPAAIGSSLKVLDLLMSSSKYTERLQKNTDRFRSKITAAGFTVIGTDHPICPIMLNDAKLASDFAEEMLKKGIFVTGFSYPVVPKEKARIRVVIGSTHTDEQIDKCVDAFIEVGRELGVINV